MAHPFGEIPIARDTGRPSAEDVLSPEELARLTADFKLGDGCESGSATTLGRDALRFTVPKPLSDRSLTDIVEGLGKQSDGGTRA